MTPPDRQDLIERDLQSHAKSLSEIVITLRTHADKINEFEREQAVAEIAEKLKSERIEEKLAALDLKFGRLEKLGWWIFTAFASSAVALIVNFVAKGGLVVK